MGIHEMWIHITGEKPWIGPLRTFPRLRRLRSTHRRGTFQTSGSGRYELLPRRDPFQRGHDQLGGILHVPQGTFSMRRAVPRPRSILGAPSTLRDEREIARLDAAKALRVEHDRDARREVRLARDELAAPGDLDDDAILIPGAQGDVGHHRKTLPRSNARAVSGTCTYTRRNRRTVRPEPRAPRQRPIPSRIRAV